MGNRRIILCLLTGIAACGVALWVAHRREYSFTVERKVADVLCERPLDRVDTMIVERGDARIGISRQGARWEMVAPFPARVDQGRVARLLDAFENARVVDALGLQELRKRELSLKEFGLNPAHTRVLLRSPQASQTFYFGSYSPMGQEVYLRTERLDQVLVAPASLYDALPRTADDLRSRKLLHSDRALLRTVELRAPGRPFIKLSKEKNTWRLLQPVDAPASDAKVEELLDVLCEAPVMRFVWPTVSNVMDVAEAESSVKARMGLYGFGTDAGVHVQVQEAGGKPPVKIVFGLPLAECDGLSYALLQGGDAIGAVSNAVVRRFNLAPSDLRDTRLFFEKPENVRRMQVYFGDLLFVLTQSNGVWRLNAPISDVADQAATKDTVERLLQLNADFVEEGPTGNGAASTGERNVPVSHVEVFSDQGSWRFSMTQEDYQGAHYRVAFTNTTAVFHVASSNVPPALVSMAGLIGLRDKTVLALAPESLRRVMVRAASGKSESLQRDDGGSVWRLGEGMAGKVHGGNVSVLTALLGKLKADRVEKLGLSVNDLDSYGLRLPWLEVSADVDAADAVRKTLLVGKDAGFGKRYAVVRGTDILFVLDEAVLKALAAPLVEPL